MCNLEDGCFLAIANQWNFGKQSQKLRRLFFIHFTVLTAILIPSVGKSDLMKIRTRVETLVVWLISLPKLIDRTWRNVYTYVPTLQSPPDYHTLFIYFSLTYLLRRDQVLTIFLFYVCLVCGVYVWQFSILLSTAPSSSRTLPIPRSDH